MTHRKLAAILTAAFLLAFQPGMAANGEALHVLLQGDSSDIVASAAEENGGVITHQLPIINAVGAKMTRQQLDAVLATGVVHQHMDDLGDPDPPTDDPVACRVRGQIELKITDGHIIWPVYNKKPEPARMKTLELSWPESLGRIVELRLGEVVIPASRYEHAPPGLLKLEFTEATGPVIATRADLRVTFSPGRDATSEEPTQQSGFKIVARFFGDCETDLVPGYTNNHEDYYYNTVAGVDPLHLEGIRGQGVTVAIADSGLWEHPALMQDSTGKLKVLARYDAMTDTLDKELVDESGHGTHMTSIIAHSGPTLKNGKPTGTYKGVAPDAGIVAVKILDRAGFAHMLDIVRAIQWVVDNREKYNIRVLNLSIAQQPRWHYWEDPVNQAAMRAWAAGIVVVAAAGNEGPDPMTIGSPGNLPYAITVGAVTDSWTPETRDDDYIPDFSSRGPTPSGHVKPDIVALGGHMTGLIHPESSLAVDQPEDLLLTGEYASTGSSQAAAFISGLVALLLQLEPELTPDDVKCKLTSSAEPAINRDGKLAYSPFAQGYGYVTASRAVTLGETGCGNTEFDVMADIRGERHFYGPAAMDEKGNTSLPGVESIIASEPSEKGMSATRKWGAKDHIERMAKEGLDPSAGKNGLFDWQALYLMEKSRIEALSRGNSDGPPADR
ncbi:MAG: S8 family peptidase [Halioglobus sp.]